MSSETGDDPTGEDAVARLLARSTEQPGRDAAGDHADAAAARRTVRTATAGLARRGRGLARRTTRRLAQERLGPLYQRAIVRVDDRLGRMLRDALDADPSLAQVRELSARGAFDTDDPNAAERDHAVGVDRINLELLKGEVRHLQHRLEELGMAFAPGTGIDGAGARFAELRETVHALERRLRTAPTHQPAEPSGPTAALAPPRPTELASTLFDYVGFERRFRGDPDEVLDTLVERYAEDLVDHQPVVDVGCGRAELLSRLAEQGARVIGVEPDPGMAAEARARGVEIHQELAADWLRTVPDRSLGSIITTHVLEHLQLDDLIELLELAAVKLRPGGVFISETPNPTSLIVLGNSYLLDPTHVRPLHPSLLSFLCEKSGFRDVRLRFFAPATGYQVADVPVPTEPGDDATDLSRAVAGEVAAVARGVNEGFGRLNEVLFGPQDYCVVARTAPAPW